MTEGETRRFYPGDRGDKDSLDPLTTRRLLDRGFRFGPRSETPDLDGD